MESDFSATGSTIGEKLNSIREKLPCDLASRLDDIIDASAPPPGADSRAAWAKLFFDCGQVTQALKQLRQERAADSVLAAHSDNIPSDVLERTDLDAVARFIAARDKLMRVVADFTLKALLFSIGLLVLGLILGII